MKVTQILTVFREMGFVVTNDPQNSDLWDIWLAKKEDLIALHEQESDFLVRVITKFGATGFKASDYMDVESLKVAIEEFLEENNSEHYGYDYVGFAVGEEDSVTITVSPGNKSNHDFYCPKRFTTQDRNLAILLKTMVLVSNLKQDHQWGKNDRYDMEYRFPDKCDSVIQRASNAPHWKTVDANNLLKKFLANHLSTKILTLQ
jgi:hypothetical protein